MSWPLGEEDVRGHPAVGSRHPHLAPVAGVRVGADGRRRMVSAARCGELGAMWASQPRDARHVATVMLSVIGLQQWLGASEWAMHRVSLENLGVDGRGRPVVYDPRCIGRRPDRAVPLHRLELYEPLLMELCGSSMRLAGAAVAWQRRLIRLEEDQDFLALEAEVLARGPTPPLRTVGAPARPVRGDGAAPRQTARSHVEGKAAGARGARLAVASELVRGLHAAREWCRTADTALRHAQAGIGRWGESRRGGRSTGPMLLAVGVASALTVLGVVVLSA